MCGPVEQTNRGATNYTGGNSTCQLRAGTKYTTSQTTRAERYFP
jgi:hypothetical protein